MNQPARNYPLRSVNEPAVYVMGERQGQKIFPNAAGPGPVSIPPAAERPGMNYGMPGMGMPGNPQAMLAHQNSNMDALDRRAQRERGGGMVPVGLHPLVSQKRPHTPSIQRQSATRVVEEDDSAGAYAT